MPSASDPRVTEGKIILPHLMSFFSKELCDFPTFFKSCLQLLNWSCDWNRNLFKFIFSFIYLLKMFLFYLFFLSFVKRVRNIIEIILKGTFLCIHSLYYNWIISLILLPSFSNWLPFLQSLMPVKYSKIIFTKSVNAEVPVSRLEYLKEISPRYLSKRKKLTFLNPHNFNVFYVTFFYLI